MSTPAYFITEQGTWPTETFKISLCTQIINPDLFAIPADNSFRFVRNPTVPIDFYSKYYYYNATPTFDDDGTLIEIDTKSNTLLEWNVGQERIAYNVGNTFNTLSIDSQPGLQSDEKYRSYILYPKRLFLKPTGKPVFSGGTCTLNTQTVLLDTYSAFHASSSLDLEAAYENLKYISTYKKTPNTTTIPSSVNYSTIYNLSASRTRADLPVFTFIDPTVGPYYFSTVLESVPPSVFEKSRLRRDSTYISYITDFYGIYDNGSTILTRFGQQRPDMGATTLPPTIKSSYIINKDTPINKQTYQLIQLKADTSGIPSTSSIYCILSGVFDLSNSNFSYFNNNYNRADSTLVTLTTGVLDTYVGVSYIADCPVMQFTNETWQSTLYSTTVSLGVPINNNSLPASMNWVTKYPPHYYSYKAYAKDNSTGSLLESADLTFYLYTCAISSGYGNKGYTNSVTLSTYIVSDFGFVNYDLQAWENNGDFVKFNVFIDTVVQNSIYNTTGPILSTLSAYYGNRLNNYYSLIDRPWIPAASASNLILYYPDPVHGEINLTIRPTLCSYAGYLDAYQSTQVKIAENQLPSNAGQPIFVSKISENQDYMEVDASFLISDSSWPTRDLRDSYISWFFEPSSSFVSINAIDVQGNYLQTINPLSAVAFGENTWTILISGYGPQTTVLSLSSQKYNEVTSVTSNSSLFDYFTEGKLLVGSPNGLNNFNEIRTIYLTAAVPYKGRQYELPANSLLSWTWTYNSEIDFDYMPVSGFLSNSDFYPYGYDLEAPQVSAINIAVQPPLKNDIPSINDVRVTASIDSPNGLVIGEYAFQVDDFPDRGIFNTDLYAFYRSYANSLSSNILDTKERKYVVTRPNNGTNYFVLCANRSAIDTYTSNTLIWSVSSTTGLNQIQNNQKYLNLSLYQPSKTTITLSSVNTIVPGWTSAHNIQTTVTFYILENQEFVNDLEFLAIPEFFWQNGRYLTLSDTSNYTLIPLNTAYENKQSNSQRYYLSSNKSFLNDYRYSTESTSINVSSYYELVDVPYSDSMFTENGLVVSVTGFNDTFFPEYLGLYYQMPAYGSLVTFPYPITSKTKSTTGINPLSNNLKLVPYSTITTSFTSSVTSVKLDTDRLISITQNISTYPLESPIQPVGGTITYTLSTRFWSVNKEIPATDGFYNLFELSIGDPVEVLKVDGTQITPLFLSASANILKKIPYSTFDNYAENQYTGPRDIWNTTMEYISSIEGGTTILASSTAANPEIFLSTTYTLTGSDFFVQYYTPKNTSDYFVVAYMTYFGEPNSYRISDESSTLFYQYKNAGTYFISYSALYNDGSIKYYQHQNPVIVKSNWENYNPNSIRFVEETILTLPYNEMEIQIQPNEWGDSDIFNTSILRLQDNLDYLASNLQTLDTSSPSVIFGWLGSNTFNYADGIRWYTKDFGSRYYNNPSLAVSNGTSYFNNIKDAFETNDHIFVLDDKNLICLSGNNFSNKIDLVGSSDLETTFLNPISIELDETGTIAYVADPPKNKVYRFDLNFENVATLNYTLNVGGLGSLQDTNKFNSPSELAYAQENLYVLDYNNNCIKQYNTNLNWTYTYSIDEFYSDIPVNIAVHPKFRLLYVLTKSKIVYIFENLSQNYFSKFEIPEVKDDVVKIIFDEVGEFIYILTKNNVYKYSSSGYFITELDLPSGVNYVSAKSSKNRSLILISEKCIIKVQDILDIYKVGEGLPSNYWSKDQLIVDRNEFSSDTNYNRSLKRMTQNIKMLRDTFNYKLVLATEQTSTSVVTYFAAVPISVSERPVFEDLIELEELGIAVNELHVPQVINRELVRLYNAIVQLNYYLNINSYNVQENKCEGDFCWSWKAMSCYKLKLPIVRICNINPITYAELEYGFPFSYAPTKEWGKAVSECCNKSIPPV